MVGYRGDGCLVVDASPVDDFCGDAGLGVVVVDDVYGLGVDRGVDRFFPGGSLDGVGGLVVGRDRDVCVCVDGVFAGGYR